MKGRTTTRSSHQPCVHTVTPVVCRRRQSAPFLFALLTPPLGDATTFYMILLRPRRGDTLARKWRGLSDCQLCLSLLSLSLSAVSRVAGSRISGRPGKLLQLPCSLLAAPIHIHPCSGPEIDLHNIVGLNKDELLPRVCPCASESAGLAQLHHERLSAGWTNKKRRTASACGRRHVNWFSRGEQPL